MKSKIKNLAVIVEPREHKALHYVVNNFLEVLPPDWYIRIYHGTKNEDFVKPLLSKRVSLANLHEENIQVAGYSKLILSKHFWDSIPCENVLVFQTDTILLKNTVHKITDYTEYDYIGAPWKHFNKVGNGGLSFRKKSAMLKVIQEINKDINLHEFTNYHPEDLHTVNYMKKLKLNIAPVNVAKTFSVETTYYPTPFGVHKHWLYLTEPQRNSLKKHEEINKMMELNDAYKSNDPLQQPANLIVPPVESNTGFVAY